MPSAASSQCIMLASKKHAPEPDDAEKAKRRRRRVSLETKVEVLDRHHARERITDISKSLDLPISTVATILKMASQIKEAASAVAANATAAVSDSPQLTKGQLTIQTFFKSFTTPKSKNGENKVLTVTKQLRDIRIVKEKKSKISNKDGERNVTQTETVENESIKSKSLGTCKNVTASHFSQATAEVEQEEKKFMESNIKNGDIRKMMLKSTCFARKGEAVKSDLQKSGGIINIDDEEIDHAHMASESQMQEVEILEDSSTNRMEKSNCKADLSSSDSEETYHAKRDSELQEQGVEILHDSCINNTTENICETQFSSTKAESKLVIEDCDSSLKCDAGIIAAKTVNNAETSTTVSSQLKKEEKNAFAFMMANRYKQNEIIRQMAESESNSEDKPPLKEKSHSQKHDKATRHKERRDGENENIAQDSPLTDNETCIAKTDHEPQDSGKCIQRKEKRIIDISSESEDRFSTPKKNKALCDNKSSNDVTPTPCTDSSDSDTSVSVCEDSEEQLKEPLLSVSNKSVNSNEDCISDVITVVEVGKGSIKRKHCEEQALDLSLQDFDVTPVKPVRSKKKVTVDKTKKMKVTGTQKRMPRKNIRSDKTVRNTPDSSVQVNGDSEPDEKIHSPVASSDIVKKLAKGMKKDIAASANKLRRRRGLIKGHNDTDVNENNIGKEETVSDGDQVEKDSDLVYRGDTKLKKEKGSKTLKKHNDETKNTSENKNGGSKTEDEVKGKVKSTKRKRKRILVLSDESEEDFVTPKSKASVQEIRNEAKDGPNTTDINSKVVNDQQSIECSKSIGISKFFKKMSSEEKADVRNKNIIKVKADVHAAFDGSKVSSKKNAKTRSTSKSGDVNNTSQENVDETHVYKTRSSERKNKKVMSHEVEDLDKIELLEQILLPPSPIKKDQVLSKISRTADSNILPEIKLKKLVVNVSECNEGNKQESAEKHEQQETDKFKKTDSGKPVIKVLSGQNIENRKNVVEGESNRQGISAVSLEKSILDSKSERTDAKKTKIAPPVFRRSQRRKKPSSQSVNEANNTKTIKTTSSSEVKPEEAVNPSGSDIEMEERSQSKCTSSAVLSPEVNGSEKENCGHYASVLVAKPGRLRIRLKRINLPSQQKRRGRKTLGMKQEKTTDNHVKKNQAKKLLRKAKSNKIIKKSKKCIMNKENIRCSQDIIVNMALVDDLVIIDETKSSSISMKQTKDDNMKQTRKKKMKQLLLKPPPPESTSGGKIRKRVKKLKAVDKKKSARDSEIVDVGHKTSRKAARKARKTIEEQTVDVIDLEETKKTSRDNRMEKSAKDTKLAPIFCKKAKSPPPVELIKVVPLSPSRLKARQDFLQSGVPDEIRKQILVEKSQEDDIMIWPPLPIVSHVQQKDENDAVWSLGTPDIPLRNNYGDFCLGTYKKDDCPLTDVTFTKKFEPDCKEKLLHTQRLSLTDILCLLNYIKKKNPQFPVYKVFKRYLDMKKKSVKAYQLELEKEEEAVITIEDGEVSSKRRKRKRKGGSDLTNKKKRLKLSRGKSKPEEDQREEEKADVCPVWQEKTPHMWTQVFAPKLGCQVIGNAGKVKKLKSWLQEWKKKYQTQPNKQMRKKKTSKKGSFTESDDSSSWEEDDDDDDVANTYLLTGPPGIGKTATVFALAAELGYKVLEVNASSRRPGRQVMSQLAEATQSHSVNNTSVSQSTSPLAAFFTKSSESSKNLVKKVLEDQVDDSPKPNSGMEKRKGVSLVLFEDIDVVFDEWDDGFMSTVNNFIATTKRPIILTVSHPTPTVLSKIKGYYEIMEFVPPPVDIGAQHLQLISLANGHHICCEDVESLVHSHKGDIRQCLLDLQLLALSGSSSTPCHCATQIGCPDSVGMFDNQNTDVKDLSLSDIFPEATAVLTEGSEEISLFRTVLSTKLQNTAVAGGQVKQSVYAGDQCSRQQCPKGHNWKHSEFSLPYMLPFPLKDAKKNVPRYPLQPDDPLLKVSSLWERYKWLSLDDEEEEEKPEVGKEEKLSVKEDCSIPQHIQEASVQCIKSFADLYDTFAELDVLESSHSLTHPHQEIRERCWLLTQPSGGLDDANDNPHLYWAPDENISDITHDLGHRALNHCSAQITSALTTITSADWPQFFLPIDPGKMSSNHRILPNTEREHDATHSVWKQLPPVMQLSQEAVSGCLSWVRSVIRSHEMAEAVSRKRRGRRVHSHLAHSGWDITPQHRLILANALTD